MNQRQATNPPSTYALYESAQRLHGHLSGHKNTRATALSAELVEALRLKMLDEFIEGLSPGDRGYVRSELEK